MIGEPNAITSHLCPITKMPTYTRVLKRKNDKMILRELQVTDDSLYVNPMAKISPNTMVSLAGRLIIIEGNIGKS